MKVSKFHNYSRLLSEVGRTFWHLKVIGLTRVELANKNETWFVCKCECGKTLNIRVQHVRSGSIKSCGCMRHALLSLAHTKHGGTRGGRAERLYNVWSSMIKRCCNRNHKAYRDYGGRGILVCDEWRHSYQSFRDWALRNGWTIGLQLDRRDNNGGYSPENCRFVTPTVNQNNRRNNHRVIFRGSQMTVTEAARAAGVPYDAFRWKLRCGATADQAGNKEAA